MQVARDRQQQIATQADEIAGRSALSVLLVYTAVEPAHPIRRAIELIRSVIRLDEEL
jgi:hypothetical protein